MGRLAAAAADMECARSRAGVDVAVFAAPFPFRCRHAGMLAFQPTCASVGISGIPNQARTHASCACDATRLPPPRVPPPQNLSIPVTAKIRVFPDIAQTVAYARMVEAAGACLLAVHGRTREQKDLSATRADWDPIRAVKEALHIPVLANGNIRHMGDALECMRWVGGRVA